ncbi:MAG: LacI family DNA-binding transcriptional regulator, partial [Clostridiales bacterium]|nr:LacI family DNA-binding transcriptional regulator [Clostridiales bacterium]
MKISEVAAMAGVSPAAVSRYFNGGYLSDEKKKKIEEVVSKTGYVPSSSAQSLRTKKNL